MKCCKVIVIVCISFMLIGQNIAETQHTFDATETISKSDYYSLFPTNLPKNKWQQFNAHGFTKQACGVIYKLDRPAWLTPKRKRPNGMPLGGIDTGCIDLEKNGTFGYSCIFNSHVPRSPQKNQPFLGLSVGNDTWLLADVEDKHVSIIGWETIYYMQPYKEENGKQVKWSPQEYYNKQDWRVRGVEDIQYWGHYPVADLEYSLSKMIPAPKPSGLYNQIETSKIPAPVKVSLRAWSPFLLGDTTTSMMPGAVFEVNLRNITKQKQSGTLAFSFPGPTLDEVEGATHFPHKKVRGGFRGLHVTNGDEIGYALGVIDEKKIRVGGELRANGQLWSNIQKELPPVLDAYPGSSVAVDFELEPKKNKIIRFVLSWYSPYWRGGGTLSSGGRKYKHFYATKYKNALQVAKLLAQDHESLLSRVLAWQQVLYTDQTIPVWLRESLVNVLHLIAEDSMWAASGPPLADWCKPEDGFFALNECPRDCPQMGCNPCDYYGLSPIVYFFPDAALSMLRGYKAYQQPDGRASFNFSPPPSIDLDLGYFNRYQTTTNTTNYVDMVDRLWMCTGSDEILNEFYPSLKKSIVWMMNLNTSEDGVISGPTGNINPGDGLMSPPQSPGKGIKFGGEHNGVYGMSSHLGGMKLGALRQIARMARKIEDNEFAIKCDNWIKQGQKSMQKLWTGDYYLNYWEPETGQKSDLIYAYHLSGEWMARHHGLEGVFDPAQTRKTLETIKNINGSYSKFGPVMFAAFDQSKVDSQFAAFYGAYSMFISETILLAGTYLYSGDGEYGLNMAEKHWENIVCKQEMTWESPNLLRGDKDTGEKSFGEDYYQSLILWTLPAAIEGKDLAAPCQNGGLVDRMIKAAAKS